MFFLKFPNVFLRFFLCFLLFSYGFPYVFFCFPMVFLMFPIVFLWFSFGFLVFSYGIGAIGCGMGRKRGLRAPCDPENARKIWTHRSPRRLWKPTGRFVCPNVPMVFLMFSSVFSLCFLLFSYGFLCVSQCVPMIFLCFLLFSYGLPSVSDCFPMVFLVFPIVFLWSS